MREVGLSGCEPGCVETIVSESGQAVPLADLLAGASYADQWLAGLAGLQMADAAICVFEPNPMKRPQGCSLSYAGGCGYKDAS